MGKVTSIRQGAQEQKRIAPEKIWYNFHEMRWEDLSVEQVKFWESCYPLVDVVDVLTKKMPAWIDGNPAKANKKDWKRFIVGWLSRDQSMKEQFQKGGGWKYGSR